MSHDVMVSFEIYETIGIMRGPVGLEPLFQAIDRQLVTKQELEHWVNAYHQGEATDDELLEIFAKLVRVDSP